MNRGKSLKKSLTTTMPFIKIEAIEANDSYEGGGEERYGNKSSAIVDSSVIIHKPWKRR